MLKTNKLLMPFLTSSFGLEFLFVTFCHVYNDDAKSGFFVGD